MEGLNLLLHQMKDWEQEVESELVISQKILEKSKKDKLKLSDEKRQLVSIHRKTCCLNLILSVLVGYVYLQTYDRNVAIGRRTGDHGYANSG